MCVAGCSCMAMMGTAWCGRRKGLLRLAFLNKHQTSAHPSKTKMAARATTPKCPPHHPIG